VSKCGQRPNPVADDFSDRQQEMPMAKSLLALALGLIGGVLIGYLASVMGLPGWVRIIALLLCIVGGIMLMIESKNKEEASVKQRDGSEH